MRSSERVAWATAVSLAIAGGAIWLGWAADHGSRALVATLLVVTAVSSVLMALVAPRERRVLAVSLVLVLPVLGPLASAYAIGVRGRGTAEDLLHDPGDDKKPVDGGELARKLVRALPPCEALVSKDLDLRRATIARLAARANAEDLQVLRWAKTRPDTELAVEIALALEDIDQRFEKQLRAVRGAAGAKPSFDTHVAVLDTISRALLAGIIDAALVAKLASEARIHHEAAVALVPDRARELLATRARLELAVRRPELVIALLDEAVAEDPRGELGALYMEAAYAVRAFEVIHKLEARLARAA